MLQPLKISTYSPPNLNIKFQSNSGKLLLNFLPYSRSTKVHFLTLYLLHIPPIYLFSNLLLLEWRTSTAWEPWKQKFSLTPSHLTCKCKAVSKPDWVLLHEGVWRSGSIDPRILDPGTSYSWPHIIFSVSLSLAFQNISEEWQAINIMITIMVNCHFTTLYQLLSLWEVKEDKATLRNRTHMRRIDCRTCLELLSKPMMKLVRRIDSCQESNWIFLKRQSDVRSPFCIIKMYGAKEVCLKAQPLHHWPPPPPSEGVRWPWQGITLSHPWPQCSGIHLCLGHKRKQP
jgi:hypothetical protein